MELQAFLLPDTIKNKETSPSATDNELVARIRCGEMQAFEKIIRRHNQRLYRIARSILRDEHESMDVVQETYVKAYYKIHQYRGPASFASWLSRIASNEALMQIRKRNRVYYTLDDLKQSREELKSSDPEPMDEVATQQLHILLEEAVDSLPVDYRCVYVLRAIQHLSTAETALSLGVSQQVVKTRYLRAKRALRKIFLKHMEQAGLKAYEFAGQRCDLIVFEVMKRLRQH